jgi:hypothetical protein
MQIDATEKEKRPEKNLSGHGPLDSLPGGSVQSLRMAYCVISEQCAES